MDPLVPSPLNALNEIHTTTTTTTTTTKTTLCALLSNHLILCQTLPYLPPSARLSLAATSQQYRGLIYQTPLAFRHLDLTEVKAARFEIDPIDRGLGVWHNTQLDEHQITEDEFYSGPLRGIFSNLSRGRLLSSVQTLILDGLSVSAELVHDILTCPEFNIRILSLRDVRNLNERKLQQALVMACRPGRPDGTPKLKGLYIFSQRDDPPKSASSAPCSPSLSPTRTPEFYSRPQQRQQQPTCGQNAVEDDSDDKVAEDAWYVRRGKMLTRKVLPEWAPTLAACRGMIGFDAVLCTGPRHVNSPAHGTVSLPDGGEGNGNGGNGRAPLFAVATHALGGCAGCGDAPEGATVWGQRRRERGRECESADPDAEFDYPLLAPAPLHSSNLRAACCPSGVSLEHTALVGGGGIVSQQAAPRFIARCFDCLKDRYCWSCHRWWCEACHPEGVQAHHHHSSGNGGSDAIGNPNIKSPGVAKSCWECGQNCHECISKTQLVCRSCSGGYCIIHNEGSTSTYCDWCSRRGRRIRRSTVRK